MNKRGFTTIEVILTFSLVVVIMASMSGVVINYRDRVINEQIETRMGDFHNTFTKLVYDDIVNGTITSLSSCTDDTMCVNLIGENIYQLKATVYRTASGNHVKGVYLSYRGVDYLVPDTDLNVYAASTIDDKYTVGVDNFTISKDTVNNLYKVVIPIYHYGLKKDFSIKLVIS